MRTKRSLSYTRYLSKVKDAEKRGIAFYLSYDEWYQWWLQHGIDTNLSQGPMTKDTLCMCRFNDSGPYTLNNIYCDTNSNNASLRNRLWHSNTNKFHTPYGVFDTLRQAAHHLGITEAILRYRKKLKPTEYFYSGNST